MRRRDVLKAFATGGLGWRWFLPDRQLASSTPQAAASLRRTWAGWPDMVWLGPDCWANRLQDWRVENGRAVCLVAGRHRAAHCLTRRVGDRAGDLRVGVTVWRGPADVAPAAALTSCVGLRLGANGPRDDYRSAAVYGRGLDVGLTPNGGLRIGDRTGPGLPATSSAPVRLDVVATPAGDGYDLLLTATPIGGGPAATLRTAVPAAALVGTVALLHHIDAADAPPSADAVVAFDDWQISGDQVVVDPAATFGPICFAQYTLHRGVLKLTAQLSPIETAAGHRIRVDVRDASGWRTVATPQIDPWSRTAHVRAENWHADRDVPYRVRVDLPLGGRTETFDYEGTIAREPADRDEIRVAMFSCNADHGFPDVDVAPSVLAHRPDLAVFLGDQYYESQGGFGVEHGPLERSSLDFLRKWYMFGWSYREIFRHIPSAMIPDDHDVYHGNIWGEGGHAAPTSLGWGYAAQDQGGYKMPAAWVNLIQRSQTSHLPDAFDPTPVAQGITVYYTHWNYAGLSLAILEDRKFKTAPQHVLPADAKVVNGFVTNPAFDPRQHRDLPGAQLLGARQEAFLDAWAADWSHGAEFKVALSQTPFCAVHTLPAGSTSDEAVPSLPIPAPGEYVHGDAPAGDMDTDGWPQQGRDEAVRHLRRGLALHLAGDQHLATVVQYGVDAHRDAGYAFTGPALNNIWPRRWWPPIAPDHTPLPGGPAYTGDFEDAFGNRMTVHAAASPRRTGLQPTIIHDRVTGYGIVVFDKAARTVRLECWPRHTDPAAPAPAQYEGWPIAVHQEDARPRRSDVHLPPIEIVGMPNAVLQLVDEATGEIVYTLRVRGARHEPRPPAPGRYTIRVGDGDRWRRTISGLATSASAAGVDPIRVDLRGETT